MITDEERSGHALRVKGPKVIEAVVAEQYRRMPHLEERYGARGRAFCERDVGYHVRFLAASVELGQPERFVEYVAWARAVLRAHEIPAADFLVTLEALRDAVGAVLPEPAAHAARRHIDAALVAWPA